LIFDEAKAVYLGVVTDPKTEAGKFASLGYFKELSVGKFLEDLILSLPDILGSRNIIFEVGGTERAYIKFDRHTASGQLTRIDFSTMGALAMRISENRDVSFEGKINPTTTPTSGTWSTSQTIPRGQYNIWLATSGDHVVRVRQGTNVLYIESGGGNSGGTIYSDGTNVNVSIVGTTGTGFVDFWKF
jgi:hypothetical protein